MASLIETFVSCSTYNSLPHIKDVVNVPNDNSADLEYLRKLLAKHNVPEDVSIRLVHKHFDTQNGEVMTFDKLALPGYGTVRTMKPVVPSGSHQLRGIHYFVIDEGSLQAYEYANYAVPDMTNFASFLDEFSRIVSERNLQHKFGLKLKVVDELDRTSWTEFEFHQKRGTIMLQEGMPMPSGDFDDTVSTEWNAIMTDDDKKTLKCQFHTNCQFHTDSPPQPNDGNGDDGHDDDTKTLKCQFHTNCQFHISPPKPQDGNRHEADLYLGGQRVVPGTPIFEVVNAIAVQAF